MNKHIYWFR